VPQTTSILGDRYELGPVLGHGGMARVHKGKDRQLGRSVAVKVLSAPYDRDLAFVERFRREARAAARLNHPSIVAVYDSGSHDGIHYIVTELVEGETLGDVLRREPALPPERAVEIATEVSRALAAAHERGVVHRDVKPGNVMLAPDGRVKVVDFGIARAAGVESVTRSGLVLGSAPYLSPEQARGEPGDSRSDIYSLGCVLYQMLTGRAPFVAETPVATLYLHVHEPVTPPSSIRPVPPALEAVVLRCLEKDPSKRFGSASELEAALGEAAAAPDSTTTMQLPPAVTATAPVPRVEPSRVARAPRPRRPRNRKLWWWVAGFAALAVLIGLFVLALRDAGYLREARRAARETPTESPTPETPLTVEDAYLAVVGTIDAAQVADEIDEGAADDLRQRADDAFAAYVDGDAEEVEKKLQEFSEKLAEAREKEEVTLEAAGRIDEAFQDLVVAIETYPPAPAEEDGGKGDGGGGPPPRTGDGNGRGKGHGND